jgi:NADP-reducing hydrogenase subunit HndB
MPKIKNLNDLRKLRNQSTGKNPIRVKVAMATCSIASGARDTYNFITAALEKRNIDAVVSKTGCMGYCYAEPTIEVTIPGMDPVVFGQVDQKRADDIIEKYIKNGELVDGIIPRNYESL